MYAVHKTTDFFLLQWSPLDPIGRRVLQALLKAVDKRQLRYHILCRKMKMNETSMY